MTITWAILGVALLSGFLGGGHCAGMCAGIVSALASGATTTGKPWSGKSRPGKSWLIHLCYNLGRIASYSVAGAIAGTVGSLGLMLDGLLPVQITLYAVANLLLIGLGRYLAGIRGPVARREHLGSGLWSRLRPITRRVLPADSQAKALALGVLWGWLPCGLVYTVPFAALLSGNALSGAAVLLRVRPRHFAQPDGCCSVAHAATLSQQIKGGLFCIS
jgi:sulfite exporter TauE/SafE